MDKIEMLKELLSDPEVKSTLKELLEEETKEPTTKKKRGRPKGSKNKTNKNTKVIKPEDDPNFYITESGTVIDLFDLQSKLPTRKKEYRKPPTKLKKKKCERCQKEFDVYGTGYLCDKCLRG